MLILEDLHAGILGQAVAPQEDAFVGPWGAPQWQLPPGLVPTRTTAEILLPLGVVAGVVLLLSQLGK